MVVPAITGTPTALDLQRKISVKEAAALNNVSEDTFKRHYSHLIKQISPKRGAVTLGDALAIGEGKSA
jgi:DeoR/GlpR family transcriptional regulator of sugar metabolism